MPKSVNLFMNLSHQLKSIMEGSDLVVVIREFSISWKL
jgi:hypothetical protein